MRRPCRMGMSEWKFANGGFYMLLEIDFLIVIFVNGFTFLVVFMTWLESVGQISTVGW